MDSTVHVGDIVIDDRIPKVLLISVYVKTFIDKVFWAASNLFWTIDFSAEPTQ